MEGKGPDSATAASDLASTTNGSGPKKRATIRTARKRDINGPRTRRIRADAEVSVLSVYDEMNGESTVEYTKFEENERNLMGQSQRPLETESAEARSFSLSGECCQVLVCDASGLKEDSLTAMLEQ